MEIELVNLSKRFGYQWILKGVNTKFVKDEITGISGRNGSGKSTLIKLISGIITPSEGEIRFVDNNSLILPTNFFKHFSWVAPYTDLIQEFTLQEMFHFHARFKSMAIHTFEEFLHELQWKDTKEKQIRFFSSGMKQKLQLALALLSQTPVLLLDEPTSYLDEHAKLWFSDLLKKNSFGKTIVISSNDTFDLKLCQKVVSIEEMNHGN